MSAFGVVLGAEVSLAAGACEPAAAGLASSPCAAASDATVTMAKATALEAKCLKSPLA